MTTKKNVKTAPVPQQVNRRYKENMEIDSDTFKLEIASYVKNVSFDDRNPVLVGVQHCHFFHTFDSSGKKMSQCNAVGGHTHEVTITVDDEGNLRGECGPIKTNRATNNDEHTHTVTYLKSDKFKVRTYNAKAQEVIASYGNI